MIRPTFYCGHPECRLGGWPIPLPPSILPEVILYPMSMPTDIFGVNIVCRHCGHWREHRKTQWVEIEDIPKEGRTAFPTVWKVEIECEQCNSKTPARWYILEDSGLEAAKVLSFVTHAKPPLACKQGHVLSPNAKIRTVEVVERQYRRLL